MCSISIDQINKFVEDFYYGIYFGKSARNAFPFLTEDGPANNAYSHPMNSTESSIHWAWLEWHRTRKMDLIDTVMAFIVRRAIEINKLAINDGFKDKFCLFLMQLTILSGNANLAAEAADLVGKFKIGKNSYAYNWGMTGLYREAILGNQSGVVSFFELLMTNRPSGPYRMPSSKVLKAFVEKDDRQLSSSLRRLWEAEWKTLESKDNGIVERNRSHVCVSLRTRSPARLWPWPEVALAKLALRRGATIPFDSLWCPEEFLTS